MLFLTFNDAPSGIYISQVTDVCQFLNKELGAKVKLISFISLRGFAGNRYKIKAAFPGACVLPMFPKVKFWKLNIYALICIVLFSRKNRMIARGPYATLLGLKLKKMGLIRKVCFDARGAYTAELNEYDVVSDRKMKQDILEIERRALLDSDFRLAVSASLVYYWKESFQYHSEDHVIIPCTLGKSFLRQLPSEADCLKRRAELGFSANELVIAYSGSSAGWQSFSLLAEYLLPLMEKNPLLRILFLTKEIPIDFRDKPVCKGRIVQKWLREDEVRLYLGACDFGVILREPSVTNRVASPVKFAEYLSAGLPVIISEGIGDYSSFVKAHHCGVVWERAGGNSLPAKPDRSEKERFNRMAVEYFSKEAFRDQYKRLLV
jgi:hypothetical protein